MAGPFHVRRLKRVGGRIDARAIDEPDPLALADPASAVYEVDARDEHLRAEEVVERLRTGALHSTDLVRIGEGGWMTLLDSRWFAEAAQERSRVERRLQALKSAGLLVLTVVAIVLFLVLFFWTYEVAWPAFIRWTRGFRH